MQVSICMPYYERQQQLAVGLLSIRALYKHLDYEIVVCDDGSRTPVVAPGCEVVSLPRKLVPMNPCVPINRAVERASGEVIVLTNPEIVHSEDVLTPMLYELQAGTCINPTCYDETTDTWLVKPGVKNGRMPVPPGFGHFFCAMLPREDWVPFDEAYRGGQAIEDTDWGWQMHERGVEFKTLDELVVHHYRSGVDWGPGGLERNRAIFWSKWPELRGRA